MQAGPPVAALPVIAGRPGDAAPAAADASSQASAIVSSAKAATVHAAQTLHAVIVEVTDGLAVVAEGGRFLGIEGLRQAAPGARIVVSMPAGVPGIGTAAEGHLVGGDLPADAGQALSVRQVASRPAALPVELKRVADGQPVPVLLAVLRDGERLEAAPSRHASQAGGAGAPVVVEARVVASELAGWSRLETGTGAFLVPSGLPGLLPGRRVALLPLADPGGPAPDTPAGARLAAAATTPAGTDEPAVALAAVLARTLEPSLRRPDIGMPWRPKAERPAPPADTALPAGGEAAPPDAALDWMWLPERLVLNGGSADVVVLRPEAVEPRAGEGSGVRRMILALDLSRLGQLQLDVSFAPEQIDLIVRSAAPLDPQTAAEVRVAIAAAASMGAACLRGALATGLIGLPARAERPLPEVIA